MGVFSFIEQQKKKHEEDSAAFEEATGSILDSTLVRAFEEDNVASLKGRTLPSERLLIAHNGQGENCYHIAAKKDALDDIPALLPKGDGLTFQQCMQTKGENGKSLMHYLAEYDRFSFLPSILKKDEKVTSVTDLMGCVDRNNNTVLHTAAESGTFPALLEILPDNKKPTPYQIFNRTNNQGLSVFQLAAMEGNAYDLLPCLPEGERPSLEYFLTQKKPTNDESQLKQLAFMGELHQVAEIAAANSRLSKEQVLEGADEKRNISLCEQSMFGSHMNDLMSVVKKEDHLPLAVHILKTADSNALYDEGGRVLKGLEGINGLSLKDVATYRKGAPENWMTPERAARLNKLQEKSRKQVGVSFAPPQKRGSR